jgi:hypothetical protein
LKFQKCLVELEIGWFPEPILARECLAVIKEAKPKLKIVRITSEFK